MIPPVTSYEPFATGSPSVSRSLWAMRATWIVVLVVCSSCLAAPLLWGFAVVHYGWPRTHPEAHGPGGLWCNELFGLPWHSYRAAALLVLAGATP